MSVLLDAAELQRKREALSAPPRFSLVGSMFEAIKSLGFGAALRRYLAAANSPGRPDNHEIVYFGILTDHVPEDQITRFVGANKRAEFHRLCNDPAWFQRTHDKALWESTCRASDLPVPETRAVFDPEGQSGLENVLSDAAALGTFLEANERPVFAKPLDGMNGLGTLMIERVVGGIAHLHDGSTSSTSDLARAMQSASKRGYLLQEVVRPHPELAESIGGAVPTARCLVLLGDDGPRVESIVLKIPSAGAIIDNFWFSDNAMASVDPGTGRIVHAITGSAPDFRLIETAPGTGTRIIDRTLPDFEALQDLCTRAGSAFNGLRTQGWDIALSDRGPVLMELNYGGSLDLQQLANRRGALSPTYCRHLRACGYTGKLPD